jgi:hypothetical protein
MVRLLNVTRRVVPPELLRAPLAVVLRVPETGAGVGVGVALRSASPEVALGPPPGGLLPPGGWRTAGLFGASAIEALSVAEFTAVQVFGPGSEHAANCAFDSPTLLCKPVDWVFPEVEVTPASTAPVVVGVGLLSTNGFHVPGASVRSIWVTVLAEMDRPLFAPEIWDELKAASIALAIAVASPPRARPPCAPPPFVVVGAFDAAGLAPALVGPALPAATLPLVATAIPRLSMFVLKLMSTMIGA